MRLQSLEGQGRPKLGSLDKVVLQQSIKLFLYKGLTKALIKTPTPTQSTQLESIPIASRFATLRLFLQVIGESFRQKFWRCK